MMQCEIIRDLLPLYAEGLTGDAANREIEAHLAGCDACAKALEQLRVPVEQPEPQAEAWKAAVKKEKKTRRRRLVLMIAAALLLGVGICLGVLYRQDFFEIRDRANSPDGQVTAVICDGAGDSVAVPEDVPAFRLKLMKGAKQVLMAVIGDAEYQSMHWSPTSDMVALQIRKNGMETVQVKQVPPSNTGRHLAVERQLAQLVRSAPELEWVRWEESEDGQRPLLDCRFVCWSEDGSNILLSARGTDATGETRQGYLLFYPQRMADPTINPNTSVIEVVSDFSSATQPTSGKVWEQRAKDFEAWTAKQGLAPTMLHTSSLSAVATLLENRVPDCAITYYRYSAEQDTFLACGSELIPELLKQAADPHAFAVFARGEAPGNDITAVVSEELRIVLFK